MKALIILSLLGFSFLYAQEKNPKDINARKAKAIARIDERIAVMQSKKACVNSAADKAALKACHQKHKEQMKGMRDQYQSQRKEKRNRRQQN